MVTSDIRDDWWQVSDVVYDVTPVDDGLHQGLQGSVWSRPLGQLIFGSTTFNSQYAHRNWQMIRRDGLDLYIVQAVLPGGNVADFGCINTKIPETFFLDFTQPISSLKDAGARVAIVFPHAHFKNLLKTHNLHGLVLRSNRVITKLLFQYMVGINSYMDGVSEIEALSMQQSLPISAAIEASNGHSASAVLYEPHVKDPCG
ncbi:hypothetical protein ACFONL_16495 [Camelimonas fluminis]|uniref:Uncharacterized protein n=1 Tax=Camelimonas fluminis TaxID=1576911 RepID=A0ABV7UJQ6_9HYPH|nr:hypothetical protein [Camelimonas fluminis]